MMLHYSELVEIIGNGTAGRPHIAALLIKNNITSSIHEAFVKYLSKGRPAYVPKEKLKLKPVQDQYSNVLSIINKSYDQIHYANSIVTGHLASVVKVHETQNEILEKLNLKDLRINVGEGISGVSDKIGELVQEAKDGEEDLNKIVSKFEALMNSKK